MSEPSPGDQAPQFSLPLANGSHFSLADASGKKLVVYFYPKDNTQGCTVEALEFTELAGEFASRDTIVLGISPDSVKSHVRFQEKHELTILLGSDEDHTVAEAFGVWKEKSMYGKTYMGVERSTFLLSGDGKILQAWRKVKAKDHAAAVLEAIDRL